MLLVHLVHHGFGHYRQVFNVIAQRRHVNVEDIEPVIQIGAQMAFRNGVVGIAICGRQHSHVNVLFGARSKTAQFALFKYTQQLGLGALRHFANFVQQQLPPAASSKQPARRSTAPVNEPFSWPKISLSISVSGIAAQLTADEGPCLARAQFVQGAGHQFFSSAALAGNEHLYIARAQSAQ